MFSVSNKRERLRKGFSLVEALASVTILGLGIAAVVSALGSGARAESRTKRVEEMTRLAQHKFDELVATSTTMTAGASQNGDFTDENINDYVWSCDIEDTTVTNLESVTVTVSMATDKSASAPVGKIVTLLYVPPATGTATSTSSGTGGATTRAGTGGRG